MRNVRSVAAVLLLCACVLSAAAAQGQIGANNPVLRASGDDQSPSQTPASSGSKVKPTKKPEFPGIGLIDGVRVGHGHQKDSIIHVTADSAGGFVTWTTSFEDVFRGGSVRYLLQRGIRKDSLGPSGVMKACPCCVQRPDSIACCVQCAFGSVTGVNEFARMVGEDTIGRKRPPFVSASIRCPDRGWVVATALCDVGFDDSNDSLSSLQFEIDCHPKCTLVEGHPDSFHGLVRPSVRDDSGGAVRYVYAVRLRFEVKEADTYDFALQARDVGGGSAKIIYAALLDLSFHPDFAAKGGGEE